MRFSTVAAAALHLLAAVALASRAASTGRHGDFLSYYFPYAPKPLEGAPSPNGLPLPPVVQGKYAPITMHGIPGTVHPYLPISWGHILRSFGEGGDVGDGLPFTPDRFSPAEKLFLSSIEDSVGDGASSRNWPISGDEGRRGDEERALEDKESSRGGPQEPPRDVPLQWPQGLEAKRSDRMTFLKNLLKRQQTFGGKLNLGNRLMCQLDARNC